MSRGIDHYRIVENPERKNYTDSDEGFFHVVLPDGDSTDLLCDALDQEDLEEFKKHIKDFNKYIFPQGIEVLDLEGMLVPNNNGESYVSSWEEFEGEEWSEVRQQHSPNKYWVKTKTKVITKNVITVKSLEWFSSHSIWKDYSFPESTIYTREELKEFIEKWISDKNLQNWITKTSWKEWAEKEILAKFIEGTDYVSVG
jgi:hypothetical protein